MTNPTCQLIIDDLLQNKGWSSALQISLYDKPVVVARERSESPLVVFVPVGGTVKLSDLTLYVDRVRQLALDLSTGEVAIERYSETDNSSEQSSKESAEMPPDYVKTPDIFSPMSSSSRFQEDLSFSRDKCLRLHREVYEKQFEFEIQRDAENKKRARVEEIRLGLFPDDDSSEQTSNFSIHPSLEVNGVRDSKIMGSETLHGNHQLPDPTIDFYTSVMFVFYDSGTLSYFHAASGLAPPQYCPDDSDDEKPIDIVQQEQKQAQRKRKNVE